MMKICYLVLAHDNFSHLDRLIEALNDEDSSFCIHIDRKSDCTYTPSRTNVAVIPRRVAINWGGFSMVEATLALMEYGLHYWSDADYYILISGVDYPIRSKSFLHNLLKEKKEYIDIAPVPVPYKPVERYEYRYFDYNRRNIKYYNPKFIAEVLLKKLKIKRSAPFRIFAGTQWFALTDGCVKYILDTTKTDKRYVRFFRHTLVPDEAFFQTIIGNSPYLCRTLSSLTYTDWNVAVPPATIEDRHIAFLKTHITFEDEYGVRFPYFARKFNDQSEELLEQLKASLWEDGC